jgi:hypothetical protein
LAEASTSRSGAVPPGPRRLGQHGFLQVRQLLDAALGQAQHRVQLPPRERHALGGALHLDESSRPGHDDVHVDLGP